MREETIGGGGDGSPWETTKRRRRATVQKWANSRPGSVQVCAAKKESDCIVLGRKIETKVYLATAEMFTAGKKCVKEEF